MSRASSISGGQCVALLLASRLSNCLLLTPESVAEAHLTDSIFSSALSGVLLFFLFLPTLLVLRPFRNQGLVDIAYRHSRAVGRSVSGLYLLVCLFILCLDVAQFYDFAEKSMKSEFSVTALTVAIVGVAFLAAFYGIQALGRTALPVAAFSTVCLLVFSAVLTTEVRSVHFSPAVGSGFAEITWRAVRELPRTAEIVAVGLLYPYINGSKSGVFAAFSGLTTVFTILVSYTAMGVLGDFSAQVAYPYYAAVGAVRFGAFQQMDMLVTTVWLGTFFVRLTLFCSLFLGLCGRLLGRRARVPAAVVATVLLAGFTCFIGNGGFDGGWAWITAVYWWVLGVICLALPLLIGIIVRRKWRRVVSNGVS